MINPGWRVSVIKVCLFLAACGNSTSNQQGNNDPAAVGAVRLLEPLQKTFTLQDYYLPSQELDSIVQRIFEGMTEKERAAQLIMDGASELKTAGLPFERAEKLVADSVIGGLLFLKGKRSAIDGQINKLDSAYSSNPKNKLLYSCDCEPTLFHRKIINAERVKASINLKHIQEVGQAAADIAGIIGTMGIQINFAPVADIGLNRKAINSRSFGNDPAEIVDKSVAFVKATQGLQIVACVKHFPGHGAIEGDTHKGQVLIDGDLTELPTFRSVIELSRPIMVMVGHMSVKNNARYGTGGQPCSVSKEIITKLLKQELAYQGIVITDAMRMSALDRTAEADWKALLAGADIVLLPRNARLLNNRIIRASSTPGALRDQLEASVKKVLRLKVCLGRIS